MKHEIKKIAIVRLSALGDIINSAVVLQFIVQEYPDIEIDWYCEEIFASLLKSHPLIHKLHIVNLKTIKQTKSFTQLKDLILYLRSQNAYDVVIDMQGLVKSAIISRLLSPKTHGFDKHSIREPLASLLYNTTTSIPYTSNIIERNCKVICEPLHFEITPQMLLEKKPVFAKDYEFVLQNNKPNIAFVIGASWESKKYPKELVIKVCQKLDAQCYIIWGNHDEKKDAEFICQHTPNATLAPQLNLCELISFISQMDLLIGNDTGPTHMAWAQNIPSITLFGPTTTRMIYETPLNIGIQSDSQVDILKIDKNDFSIQTIDPQKVIDSAKRLLHGI